MESLLYLLIGLAVAACFLFPAEAIAHRWRRQDEVDPWVGVILGVGIVVLLIALFYLLVVALPLGVRQWACRLFLGVGLGLSGLYLARTGKPLLIFTHRAFHVYIAVFLIALFVPHLFQEVRYDLMPNRTHSSRVANYQSDSKIPFNVLRMFSNYDLRDRRNTLDGWPVRPPLMAFVSGPFVHVVKKKLRYRRWERDVGKWGYFTDDGFWLFRIVGTALNALVVFVPFLLGRLLGLSHAVQTRAAIVLGLGVFTVVNIYFTWPKFLCCFLLAAGLVLLVERKSLQAGAHFGMAYLAHPLAALYLPGYFLYRFFGGWNFFRTLRDRQLYLCIAGLALTLAPWVAYDVFINANNIFLRYPLFEKAGTSWFWFRVQSLFNTLLPYGFSYNPQSFLWDRGLQAIPAAEATALWLTWTNYTTTLAGALGLGFCWVAYYAMVRRYAEFQRAILCLFVVPFISVLVYWGFTCHGFMKEAGQPLLFVPLLLGASILETARQRFLMVGIWATEFLFFLLAVNFSVSTAGLSILAAVVIAGSYFLLAWLFVRDPKFAGR